MLITLMNAVFGFHHKRMGFLNAIIHKHLERGGGASQNSLDGFVRLYDRMVMDKDGLGDGCTSACCLV